MAAKRPKIELILDKHSFKVDKKRIMDRSRYFESLFSHNFADSNEDRHVVNYKIYPNILQDFCDWIEEDPPSVPENESHQIKISLQKYLSDSFNDLKKLLEVSVIYSVEELTQELSDIIIQHWLSPERMLDIWHTARELSLTVLRNVSYAACIEGFEKLLPEDVTTLPFDEFYELVRNVNLQTSNDYLRNIIDERIALHHETDDDEAHKQFMSLRRKLKKRAPVYMHCFATEAVKSEQEMDFLSRVVYSFNSETEKLNELIEVWRMDGDGKDLAGMGIVGRGYSIYKIGGEHKIGSCKFNMNIWRYCLISKKWYYQARLRKARRHMGVALVDDKLILLGGVGRYRLKLGSVEVLDLSRGLWDDAPNIPETFTDVPATCVINGIVAVCISDIYMLNHKINVWLPVTHELDASEFRNVKCMVAYKDTLYIGKEGGFFVGYDVSWRITKSALDGSEVIRGAEIVRSEHKSFQSPCEKIQIDDEGHVFGIVYGFQRVTVEFGKLDETTGRLDSRLHNFNMGISSLAPLSCFKLLDPTKVYKLLS